MKTEMEVLDGVLVFKSPYENLKAVLDMTTGEVIHLEYSEVNIMKLNQFITKVKSRYSHFVAKQLADEFAND